MSHRSDSMRGIDLTDLSERDAEIVRRIDEYVKQHNLRGRALIEAASDVLDGDILREDLDTLVRKRLLGIVRFKKTERNDLLCHIAHRNSGLESVCGTFFTVDLTDLAIRRFWPERVAAEGKRRTAQN